jgi:MFS family permease
MGSSAGQVLIAVTLLGLRSMMGEDAFVSSAWRIPFVIGVGLAVVGYVLRRKATTERPLATVLKTYRSHVVRLAFLRAANIARCSMVTTYSLEYLKPFVAALLLDRQARPGVSPGCRGSRGLGGRRQDIYEVDVRYR